MRYRLLALLALLCLGSGSQAQKLPDVLNPLPGETLIQGTVAIVIPAESRVVVSVTRTVTGGAEKKLNPPRLRSVLLADVAKWRDGAKPVPKPEFSVLRRGAPIAVAGKPVGAVDEISARAVSFDSTFIEVTRAPGDSEGFFGDLRLLAKTHPNSRWELWVDTKAGAYATIAGDGDALKVNVERTAGRPWDVMLVQTRVPVKNERTYTLRFRAKADSKRTLQVVGQNGDNLTSKIGLEKNFVLGPEWRQLEFTFTARGVVNAQSNLLPFYFLGDKIGSVWFADVSVTEKADGAVEGAQAQP